MHMKKGMLSGGRASGRLGPDEETTDRLVSAVMEGDPTQVEAPADRSADEELLVMRRLIASIRQVGAADSPLPESRVDAVVSALEREARRVPRQGAWREHLGMAAGFIACTVTLGSGLLLMGGTGDALRSPDALATPLLAAAVASLAALVSVLVHRQSKLRLRVLPLLVLVTLGLGSCAPGTPDIATGDIEIAPSALKIFQEGEELWGVRDIIASGEQIWVLTAAAPFLRAYDRSGRMLGDFGSAGEGPGELGNPWILSAATSAGGVVAWDLATRRRSRFDAGGQFVSSSPAPVSRESIRADIRSVTFGDPFRVAEDSTGVWVASYPGALTEGDHFWGGKILRITHGDPEPAVVVDFAVDLPGAANRVPAIGLAPVPLWDGCADGVVAVLDPVHRSLHLYGPDGTKHRRIPLPWTGRPLSHDERLGYVRARARNEMRGSDVSDAEIERAAADVLARAGDQMPEAAPIGVDVRCSPGRIWIQEFDGSSHPLGYGRAWMTVTLSNGDPRFQRVVFPEGFAPYRLTDEVAIGVVTDSVELQRVAVVRLAGGDPLLSPHRAAARTLPQSIAVASREAAGNATAQDAHPIVFADMRRQLVLDEKTAIGSMDGEHDAFGRIMSLAIDSRRRLVLADDLSHDLKVFELTGEFVATVGRSGEGPGEFLSPWQVQAGPGDSLYVWDPGRAAISVFGPDYEFNRSFPVPAGWTVNSMIVHPGPEIVVSVSGTGELLPIRILSGDGKVTGEAGPPMPQRDLAGFEDSLLGGSLSRTPDGYVYSQKSPYAVWQLDDQLRLVSVCQGRPEWTTDPDEVVVRSDRGVGLRWNRFSHSASILPLPTGHLLNTVLMPETDQRLLHVLGEGCRVISELLLDIPVLPLAVVDDLLVAVRTLDYPEVVISQMSWGERKGSTDR